VQDVEKLTDYQMGTVNFVHSDYEYVNSAISATEERVYIRTSKLQENKKKKYTTAVQSFQ
jgi:hypothetical protein